MPRRARSESLALSGPDPESAEGSADLYDFSARSYDPGLGAFTSFDSVTGSAQNPLTLNRYLYANANPATLVDPDGHFVPAVAAAAAACIASNVCAAVAAVGIALSVSVLTNVVTHPEWAASLAKQVDGAGRAVVGVGDWGLQKSAALADDLFGLHRSSRAAVTLALAGALKQNTPPIVPPKSRLPLPVPPVVTKPLCEMPGWTCPRVGFGGDNPGDGSGGPLKGLPNWLKKTIVGTIGVGSVIVTWFFYHESVPAEKPRASSSPSATPSPSPRPTSSPNPWLKWRLAQ